jgi:hypothetical protein
MRFILRFRLRQRYSTIDSFPYGKRPGMAELNATLEGVCHGDWGEGRQNHLRCTLKDVLLDSYFIAQVLPRALGLRCRTPIAL